MSFGNIFIIIMTFFAQFIFIGSIWLLSLSVLLPSGVLWNKQKRKKNQAQKHDFVILCVFPAENTGLLISLLKCFRIIIYSIVESKANVFSIKKNMKKKWFFYHFYVIVIICTIDDVETISMQDRNMNFCLCCLPVWLLFLKQKVEANVRIR